MATRINQEINKLYWDAQGQILQPTNKITQHICLILEDWTNKPSQTLVTNYQPMSHNIQEQQRPHAIPVA